MGTVLYVDGRNFLGKLEKVFQKEKKLKPKWHEYDFQGLLGLVLKGLNVENGVFYFARIKEHPDTKEKSQQLIQERRLLKTHLEKQGFRVVLTGAVRGNYNQDGALVFKEKGVDVSIAVDMVSAVCDKMVATAVLASSDSDLQPAVREVTKRNAECIYLGFELMPNKGLASTSKRTILIRDSEVLQFYRTRVY